MILEIGTSSKDMDRYLSFCCAALGIDKEESKRLAVDAIKYYRGDQSDRQARRAHQELEGRWYQSLDSGTPDYSVYSDPYFVCEMWACWSIYSSKYISLLRKKIADLNAIKNITSIVDLGCGVGLTSAALVSAFPGAIVTGTNIDQSPQFNIARDLGAMAGFKVTGGVEGKADLVFASEYFEHIERPVDHLIEILDTCSPAFLVIANSFNTISIGHFRHYGIGSTKHDGRESSRLFNSALRTAGYLKLNTGFWNNRPSIWVLASVLAVTT